MALSVAQRLGVGTRQAALAVRQSLLLAERFGQDLGATATPIEVVYEMTTS
jgi:hypothetical protein